jgi:hypothetical protein
MWTKPTSSTVSSTTAATSSAPAGRASAQAAGSTVVTDALNGFAVTLPAGYRRITDKAQLESVMKTGTTVAGSRYEAVMNQYASVGANARVLAFKLGAADFSDNLNILAGPAEGMDAEHIGDIYDKVRPALAGKLGATITGHKIEMVAGTKALRIEYRLTVAQRSLRGTQIYLIHNGRAVVTTITQNDVAASKPEANMIVGSLRFI